MMLPTRYQYIELIAKVIYFKVIRGNEWIFTRSVILGVGARVLSLIGFAVTLQAIVAAIRPDIILRHTNGVLEKFGIGITIEENYLGLLMIGAILLIYSITLTTHYVRSILMRQLNDQIVNAKENFTPTRTIDTDIFILEQMPTIAQSIERCIELVLFTAMVFSLILFLMPALAIFLVPLLAALVLFQIFGDRAKLQDLKAQQDARTVYINQRNENGALVRRPAPENVAERASYVNIREKRRHHVFMKPQYDSFAGAVGISAVVLYLLEAQLSTEQLAGLLIVFVVAIRNVINTGRELSANFSRILDLRKDTAVLTDLMKETEENLDNTVNNIDTLRKA